MDIHLDVEADALYIKFQDGEFAENKKVDEDTIIDLGENGEVLGIEILNATKHIPRESFADVNIQIPVEKHSGKATQSA